MLYGNVTGSYYFFLFLAIAGIVSMVGLLVGPKLFIKRNKCETVEFYPPKGYSPIDVAKALRGYVRAKDFTSLILHWAEEGFITIEQLGEKDFVLKKVREMRDKSETQKQMDAEEPNRVRISPSDKKKKRKKSYANLPLSLKYLENDNKESEIQYFEKMFEGGDFRASANGSEHKRNLSEAADNLSVCETGEMPFSKYNIFFIIFYMFLSLIPTFAFFVWIMVETSRFDLMFFFLFVIVGTYIILVPPLSFLPKLIVFFNFNITVFVGVCAISGFVDFKCIAFIVLAFATNVIGNLVLLKQVSLRTRENCRVLGLLYGFKNFLLKAEIAKLEMLIEENPNYYFDILPYCQVFNITKKMDKKFKPIRRAATTICALDELELNFFSSSFSSCIVSYVKAYPRKSKKQKTFIEEKQSS